MDFHKFQNKTEFLEYADKTKSKFRYYEFKTSPLIFAFEFKYEN